MVEGGGVTHPDIAKRIAKYYGLTEDEMLELIPKDSERRKLDDARFMNRLMFVKLCDKDKEINCYSYEHRRKLECKKAKKRR